MDSLLGHGETARSSPAAPSATARRARGNGGEWLPSEGGPLTVLPARTTPADASDHIRFAVEAPAPHETGLPSRERELSWKLHELLASPLGDGIARIVEESHRLLSQSRASS
jgi:hypothetical protein